MFQTVDKKIENALTPIEEVIARDVSGSAFGFPSYTVSELPSITKNMVAFATDGRKQGDSSGNGTGVPVWFDEDSQTWVTFYNNQQVRD